jgi:hypothetical protein
MVSEMSDDETRLLPLYEVDLTNAVGLVLARQFRKGQIVSRQRVDAVEDYAPSDPVVPMPPGEVVVRAVRIEGDAEIGPVHREEETIKRRP